MGHWRKLYDSKFLGSWNLDGKTITCTIESVKIEELQNEDGKSNKPVVYFNGAKKGWVMPKTCAKIIAALYGNDVLQWIGKQVDLYPTTCQAFGRTVECVRVKDQVPTKQEAKVNEDALPPDDVDGFEPEDDGSLPE